MSARSQMKMRAFLTRDTETDRDKHGHPVKPNFQAYLTSPCWAWSTRMEEAIDSGKTAVIERVKMTVPRGTDVTSDDRVSDIKDRLSVVQFSGPFVIDGEPQLRQGHLLLTLRKVA